MFHHDDIANISSRNGPPDDDELPFDGNVQTCFRLCNLQSVAARWAKQEKK